VGRAQAALPVAPPGADGEVPGKFLAYLRKALDKGQLVLPPDLSEAQAQSLLNRLGRLVWNVKIFDPYEHGRGVARTWPDT